MKDNIWVNNGEIPDNKIDDDKNGYVDDYYGVDIVAKTGVIATVHTKSTNIINDKIFFIVLSSYSVTVTSISLYSCIPW